jgi:hypothetical protein
LSSKASLEATPHSSRWGDDVRIIDGILLNCLWQPFGTILHTTRQPSHEQNLAAEDNDIGLPRTMLFIGSLALP